MNNPFEIGDLVESDWGIGIIILKTTPRPGDYAQYKIYYACGTREWTPTLRISLLARCGKKSNVKK